MKPHWSPGNTSNETFHGFLYVNTLVLVHRPGCCQDPDCNHEDLWNHKACTFCGASCEKCLVPYSRERKEVEP